MASACCVYFFHVFQQKNADGNLSRFFPLQFRIFFSPFKRKFGRCLEIIVIVVQDCNLCPSDPNISPTLVLCKPCVALRYPKKMQTPLQGWSPVALSWGVQTWDLLRSAWPSHSNNPDFGTSEPFAQFWQGLWESVWSLWVAHSASAERRIYEQPLGFGYALVQQCQWRGKPSVEGVFCDVPHGNSDGLGDGNVLGHFWTWQLVFPKERWKGWFPTWVSSSLMYLLSKT